eukprot:UN29793
MAFLLIMLIPIIYCIKETVIMTELEMETRQGTTLWDTIKLTKENMNWKAGVATMSCLLIEWNFNTLEPIAEKHNERSLFGHSMRLELYTGLLLGGAAFVYSATGFCTPYFTSYLPPKHAVGVGYLILAFIYFWIGPFPGA